MRAIVFSDLHVHPWAAFSRLDENGTNNRLADTLAVLEIVAKTAKAKKADCIFFAGDFFHTQRIDAETIHLAAEALQVFSINTPIIAIEGNHDQAAKIRNLTSVSGLRVPSQWHWLRGNELQVKGVTVWGAPYGFEGYPDPIPDVTLLHRGVRGADVSDYFLSPFEHDLAAEDAKLYAKKLVICGHYHKPQVFRGETTILIPGSPLQHTWGDTGQDRGIWMADINDTVELTFIPLDMPKFIRVTSENVEDLAKAGGNFVSVEFAGNVPAKDLDEMIKDLADTARGYSVNAADPDMSRPVGERIKMSSDLEEAVRDYAKKFGGENSKALEGLGIELLKESRG